VEIIVGMTWIFTKRREKHGQKEVIQIQKRGGLFRESSLKSSPVIQGVGGIRAADIACSLKDVTVLDIRLATQNSRSMCRPDLGTSCYHIMHQWRESLHGSKSFPHDVIHTFLKDEVQNHNAAS
jgi:hypothetical protein